MMHRVVLWSCFWGFLVPLMAQLPDAEMFLPVAAGDRHSVESLRLTAIGTYGLRRAARTHVPAHLHTGIDIQRPHKNYVDEPVYPIARGKVISVRTDGPYAQIIIEHACRSKSFWTVYEHIAGVRVAPDDSVDPGTPIARFMSRAELQKNGWQFDHVYFEALKVRPMSVPPDRLHPDRYFRSYSLVCYTNADLRKYFIDPMELFRGRK